jgi:hypothetical protein
MPNRDGTGPRGEGPLTGQGLGYCVLRESETQPGQFEGLAGVDGIPVGDRNRDKTKPEKEVIQMPWGNGTGPTGMGPLTGRAAGFCGGYPVPGYRNPGVFAGRRALPYGAPMYGAGAGYTAGGLGWFGRWIRGGLGLGRGFGRGRGRGRRGGRGGFGYW